MQELDNLRQSWKKNFVNPKFKNYFAHSRVWVSDFSDDLWKEAIKNWLMWDSAGFFVCFEMEKIDRILEKAYN